MARVWRPVNWVDLRGRQSGPLTPKLARMSTPQSSGQPSAAQRIAFIGGGNMACAIIGGLIDQGMAPAAIHVVEPLSLIHI